VAARDGVRADPNKRGPPRQGMHVRHGFARRALSPEPKT
jgi:hypothetical protein